MRLERNRWEARRNEFMRKLCGASKEFFFEAAAIGTLSDCFFDASGRDGRLCIRCKLSSMRHLREHPLNNESTSLENRQGD